MNESPSVILRNALVVCAAVWVAWWQYSERIAPLAAQKNAADSSVAELRERIQGERKSIIELKRLEGQASKAQAEIDPLPRDVPASSPLIWFPPRLKNYFERFGIAIGITRLVTTRKEPHLPGYARSHWSIDLPQLKGDRTATSLLLAVAELERQDRFVKVMNFSFRPDLEDPGNFTATLGLSALVRE